MAIQELRTEDAKKYLGEVSKVEDNGNRVITKSQYNDWMATNGCPKAVVEQVKAADHSLIAGGVEAAADDLKVKIDAGKKAGADEETLKALESRVVLPTATGRVTVRVKAHQVNRSPKTGEMSDKYGGVSIRIVTPNAVAKEPAEYAGTLIDKAMNG